MNTSGSNLQYNVAYWIPKLCGYHTKKNVFFKLKWSLVLCLSWRYSRWQFFLLVSIAVRDQNQIQIIDSWSIFKQNILRKISVNFGWNCPSCLVGQGFVLKTSCWQRLILVDPTYLKYCPGKLKCQIFNVFFFNLQSFELRTSLYSIQPPTLTKHLVLKCNKWWHLTKLIWKHIQGLSENDLRFTHLSKVTVKRWN